VTAMTSSPSSHQIGHDRDGNPVWGFTCECRHRQSVVFRFIPSARSNGDTLDCRSCGVVWFLRSDGKIFREVNTEVDVLAPQQACARVTRDEPWGPIIGATRTKSV